MNKLMASLLVTVISQVALAEVTVSVQKSMPIATLQKIDDLLESAAQRPPEAQAFHSYLVVQKGVVLTCPPFMPGKDGIGCEISFRSDSAQIKGDLGLSIRKPIRKDLISSALIAASQQSKNIDPNTTEAHLHFGNPLYSAPANQSDGTHYFCQPEGDAGKKVWACYLNISESINETGAK